MPAKDSQASPPSRAGASATAQGKSTSQARTSSPSKGKLTAVAAMPAATPKAKPDGTLAKPTASPANAAEASGRAKSQDNLQPKAVTSAAKPGGFGTKAEDKAATSGTSKLPAAGTKPRDAGTSAKAPAKGSIAAKPMGKRFKDGWWTGQHKMFKPHGRGTYTYDSGDKYEGLFAHGFRHTEKTGLNAKARYTFANGALYFGAHAKSKFHGTGDLTLPDGTRLANVKFHHDVTKVEKLVFKDKTEFTGQLCRWMKHGKSKWVWPDGEWYEGNFKDDMMSGLGTYWTPTGDFYTGQFENGHKGKLGGRGEKGPGFGIHSYPEGDVYEGAFEDGVPHGKGVMRFLDGDSVSITVEKGVWHGTHTYTNGDTYSGPFHGNTPHGDGIMHFAAGSTYEGRFENGNFQHEQNDGKMREKGTYKFGKLQGMGMREVHGELYEGEFNQGLYHGKGLLQLLETGFRYEGEFKSGRFNGFGRLDYGKHPTNRNVKGYGVTAMFVSCKRQPEDSLYIGYFLDGQRSGKGIFECATETYNGEWSQDLPSGRGEWISLADTTVWGDSSRYVGDWLKGKRHGMGEYISEIGATYKGMWRDGKRNGQGAETTMPPGESGTYHGDFLNDSRHGHGIIKFDTGGMYDGQWKGGVRQGKGTEIFVSGAKYVGEYFNGKINGQGVYHVPPIGRDERVRAYKVRMIKEAEQALILVDAALDDGRPDLARQKLKISRELYDEAGYLSPPRPHSVKAFTAKVEVGYYSVVTSIIGRSTNKEKRAQELNEVQSRVESAEASLIESENMDPVLKRLREENEYKAKLESFKKEKEADDAAKEELEAMKAEADALADQRIEEKKAKNLRELQKMHKAKGLKGAVKVPKERPEKLAKEKKEEVAKALEELQERARQKEVQRLAVIQADKDAAYEVQVHEVGNGTYTGRFLEGQRHGFGIRVYGNGDRYEGGWRDNKRSGAGVLKYADGTVYEGPFLHGLYHGKGTLTTPISIFVGIFIDGKPSGYGELVMKDGSFYKGDYWDGKPHGSGVRRFRSGAEYVGEFKWGLFDGRGTYTYEDSSTYVGLWSSDLRHGYGVWEHVRGDRFAGEWLHDIAMNGKGVRIDWSKGSVYAGDICKGTYHGFGFYKDNTTGEVYEGYWVQGKRHGQGISEGHTETGGAGSRFDGVWQMDRPISGFGRIVYKDGGWYVGSILKVFRHGAGVMSYNNGDVYDGEWKSDLRHGHGCMVKGRTVYIGVWYYGEPGAEEPEWMPFEDDSFVDHEVDKDHLVLACKVLGCSKGRTEIVRSLMGRGKLRALARGSLAGMKDECDKLKKEEAALLREYGPEKDLRQVRVRGSALLAEAQRVIDLAAWDLLAPETQEAIQRAESVQRTLADIVDKMTFSDQPSVVAWAQHITPVRVQLPTRRRGPPYEPGTFVQGIRGLKQLALSDAESDQDSDVVDDKEEAAGYGPQVGLQEGSEGQDEGQDEGVLDASGLRRVSGSVFRWNSAKRSNQSAAISRPQSDGILMPDQPGIHDGDLEGGQDVAGAAPFTSLPSVVTWTLASVRRKPKYRPLPPPKYYPSIVTWANLNVRALRAEYQPESSNAVRNIPVMDLLPPLCKAKVKRFGDPYLEAQKRVEGLAKGGILTAQDKRYFEVLGVPPGVDPLVWSQIGAAQRQEAWVALREEHDRWQYYRLPSVVSWSLPSPIGHRLRGGLFGGEEGSRLAGIRPEQKRPEVKQLSEDQMRLVRLWFGNKELKLHP